MVNTGPHAHVCRHMCQQTLCLSGVHGYLLQAVTLRKTVPNQSFPGILHYCYSRNQTILKMPASESPTALYSPNVEAQRLPPATPPFLERSTNTKHLLKALRALRAFMQGWSPSPASTPETTTHSFLMQNPDQG